VTLSSQLAAQQNLTPARALGVYFFERGDLDAAPARMIRLARRCADFSAGVTGEEFNG
jgi:hypothetical protein